MQKLFLTSIYILLTVVICHAQSATLGGTVIDSLDNKPIQGASVRLFNMNDSINNLTITDKNGGFNFNKILQGHYSIIISHNGHKKFKINVLITESSKDIYFIKLHPDNSSFTQVEVFAAIQAIKQKGDTIQYNAAAYKTNPEAVAEDLFNKLPGVNVTNGLIKANGENITKILVDGKPYFGGDITAALKNIAAETIDKIEVYNKPSEQALFTGVDDGQSIKTINIILKKDKKNGQFGKLITGYSPGGFYNANMNCNFFNDNRRLTIIGGSNNVNQQSFSSQNQGGGTNSANSFGLNYSDSISKKIYFITSYTLSILNNNTISSLTRNYFNLGNLSTIYKESDAAQSYNLNNHISLNLNYTIDRKNTIVVETSFGNQNGNRSYKTDATTLVNNEPQSNVQNLTPNNSFNYSFNNSILLEHRFTKKGRSISCNFTESIDGSNSHDFMNSVSHYFKNNDSLARFYQKSSQPTKGYSLSSNIAYTERLSKGGLFQINYTPSISHNYLDKQTFGYDTVHNESLRIDSALSNTYTTYSITNRAGINYTLQNKSMRINVGMHYQNTLLEGSEKYPSVYSIRKNFNSFLPNAMLNYKFRTRKNLILSYQSNASTPSIQQLQTVINNFNPLLISTGNPYLTQPYTETLNIGFGIAPKENGKNILINIVASNTLHSITNATVMANKDSLIYGNYWIHNGEQLNYPVNINGFKSIRTNITISQPLKKLKSNLSVNGGISCTSMPGLINNVTNFNSTYSANSNLVISSNISEKLDFILSSDPSYNIVKNTINSKINNNYYLQTSSLKLYWIIGKGISFNTEMSQRLFSGSVVGSNQNFLLWNLGLGKKIFRKNNLDFRFYVLNILNQNASINHLMTNSYVQNQQTNTLGRFFMFTLTYSLRNYRSASK